MRCPRRPLDISDRFQFDGGTRQQFNLTVADPCPMELLGSCGAVSRPF
jgi:hypothetical protein